MSNYKRGPRQSKGKARVRHPEGTRIEDRTGKQREDEQKPKIFSNLRKDQNKALKKHAKQGTDYYYCKSKAAK